MSPYYFIDLAWLEKNNRSFAALAASRLCPQNHEGLQTPSTEPLKADKLLETFQQCCAQRENFITVTQPIMESLFRLFLATKNQPLDLEEISQELGRHRGDRVLPPTVLGRLLSNEVFYGLCQIADSALEGGTSAEAA